MGRYYFRAEYNGSVVTDDEGEELPSLHAAKAHAAKAAVERSKPDIATAARLLQQALGGQGWLAAPEFPISSSKSRPRGRRQWGDPRHPEALGALFVRRAAKMVAPRFVRRPRESPPPRFTRPCGGRLRSRRTWSAV